MNTAIKPITPEREQELVEKLVDLLSSRYDAGNLYDILHHALGMDHSDMEALGFQLRNYYEEVNNNHEKRKCHDLIRERAACRSRIFT